MNNGIPRQGNANDSSVMLKLNIMELLIEPNIYLLAASSGIYILYEFQHDYSVTFVAIHLS